MPETMTIYCCGCGKEVEARLTAGAEVYPGRADLAGLPFWRCDGCGWWVGCHHKSRDRTRPLGTIATPAVKAARMRIHAALDPLWMSERFRFTRRQVYAKLSRHLGREFHTATVNSVEGAEAVLAFLHGLRGES